MNLKSYFTLISILLFLNSNAFAQIECDFEKQLSIIELPIGNKLSWTIVNNKEQVQFEIEKSTDGKNFEIIGALQQQPSSEEYYFFEFLDSKSKGSKNYYRLKTVQKDASYTHSEVVRIDQKLKNNFSIVWYSSVEVTDKLELQLNADFEQLLHISIENAKGEILEEYEQILLTNLNFVELSFQDFEKGTYKIKLQSQQEVEELAILKTGNRVSNVAVKE